MRALGICLCVLLGVVSVLAGDDEDYPPLTCAGPDGEEYEEGEPMPSDDPCENCFCAGIEGPMCVVSMCQRPPCFDSVREEGQCCGSCPNGPNCELSDGTIVPEGEEVMDGSTPCTCFQGGNSIFCMEVKK